MSKSVKASGSLIDVFTGEEFVPINKQTARHYEENDGVPVAPPVNTPRLSLRERVERLLAGGVDLSQGIYDDDDPTDWSDGDDEPLTSAEQAYVEQGLALERAEARIAAQKAAEAAPAPSGTPPSEVQAPAPDAAPNPPADGPPTPGPTGRKSP